jgi:hypothetical protein
MQKVMTPCALVLMLTAPLAAQKRLVGLDTNIVAFTLEVNQQLVALHQTRRVAISCLLGAIKHHPAVGRYAYVQGVKDTGNNCDDPRAIGLVAVWPDSNSVPVRHPIATAWMRQQMDNYPHLTIYALVYRVHLAPYPDGELHDFADVYYWIRRARPGPKGSL